MKNPTVESTLGSKPVAPVVSARNTSFLGGWNQFWFTPASRRSIVPARVAICLFVALYFANWIPSASTWFGQQGMLNHSLSSKLIAFEETPQWQLWSPLWWSESLWLVHTWLVLGVLLAIGAAVGLGGRIVQAALAIWTIAWIHRIGWLSGPAEPAMAAFLGYLVVAPERSLWKPSARTVEQAHWLSRTSLRLIQTHVWILLAGGLASQLAGMVWWRGDAVWWLASSGRSSWLTPEALSDRAELINLLTHAVILVQIVTLWLLTTQAGRRIGIFAGWLSCLCFAAVADQVLYAGLLACGLISFWPSTSKEDHGS